LKLEYTTVLTDFFKLADSIKSPDIKKFVYEGFHMIAEDFWFVPSSSSGRYHPPENNLTPLGLMVHNVKACAIANRLFGFFGVSEQIEKDIVIGAILLHDSYKGGWKSDWAGMVKEHGYIAVSYLAELELEPEYIKSKLLLCIETHMSRWARPFTSVTSFLFPNVMQLIVALSDMLCSAPKMSFYPGISVLDVNEDES